MLRCIYNSHIQIVRTFHAHRLSFTQNEWCLLRFLFCLWFFAFSILYELFILLKFNSFSELLSHWKPLETYFHFENLNTIPNGVCLPMRMLVIGFKSMAYVALVYHNIIEVLDHFTHFAPVITCDMLMDHLSIPWIEHLFIFHLLASIHGLLLHENELILCATHWG